MSASIKFQNIIPQIIPTDVTDVYDVVFNVRMPDKVPNPPSGGVAGDDEDFYCNNKLRISLSYLFDKSGKDQLKYFSSTTGQGQQTACVLTPPIEMSKAAAEYSVTETPGTPGTPGTAGTSSLDLVKASGVYFTTYDTLNEKIKKTFEDTYNKLYNGFKTFETINKRTGESLTLAQTCQKYITTASNIKTPVSLIENALTSLAKSSTDALGGITESVKEMEKLKSLDDYFSMVGTTTQSITNLKTLINVANTAATKADTDVKKYVDAQQKSKEAAAKLNAVQEKLDKAQQTLGDKNKELTAASSAASPPGSCTAAAPISDTAAAASAAAASAAAPCAATPSGYDASPSSSDA